MKKLMVPANFKYTGFYDLLCDAIFNYRLASECTDSYSANRHARASILASALTLECGANCLIDSLDLEEQHFRSIDRLSVVEKIEFYLERQQITGFLRGRTSVQKIMELLRFRDRFVHTKAGNIEAGIGQFEDEGDFFRMPVEFDGGRKNMLKIPEFPVFWSSQNAGSVLTAISEFLSFLFVEIMKASPEEIKKLLLSRLEVGNVAMPNIFQEFETELNGAISKGFPLSFLSLGNC